MHSWVNNLQTAVGSVVNDIARAADDVVEGFRNSQQPNNGGSQEQQQQQQQQQQRFPFGFGTRAPPPHPQHPSNVRTPTASDRAVRQLPEILVKPEDLVDENNRECCICLDA